MSRVRGAVLKGLQLAVAPVGLAVATGVALREAPRTRRLRKLGRKPRLLYGVTPIISLKYMSEAMRKRGYETHTYVWGVATINEASDFDASVGDLFAGSSSSVAAKARVLLGPYVALCRALRRGDVFHYFFDGGFLSHTPLRFLEVQLLHLAGKKLVVMPYGGDVAVPSEMHSPAWREAFLADYPELADREPNTRRWIRYFCRRADFVVACVVHFETLPRCDLLTTHYYPIDTDAWTPPDSGAGDGHIRVLHSSNHRALKGTDRVVEACRRLRDEGFDLELILAEGLPNTEVRRLVESCDIVAEQFVLGYALAAMEGMALGKPVLSNLSDPWYYERFRRETGLDECPIVSTSADELPDHIGRLARDAALRARLGEEGRRYVVQHHGYEPVGRMWEHVYEALWNDIPMPFDAWHPRRGAHEAEGTPVRAVETAA